MAVGSENARGFTCEQSVSACISRALRLTGRILGLDFIVVGTREAALALKPTLDSRTVSTRAPQRESTCASPYPYAPRRPVRPPSPPLTSPSRAGSSRACTDPQGAGARG